MTKISDRLVKDIEAPASGNRIEYDDDVTGFGLRVTAKGARSFVLRYVFNDPDAHRLSNEYRYTIGAYPAWSVAAARAEAKDWRMKIDRGEAHPMAQRTGRRLATAARREAETYREAVEDYFKREQEGRRQNTTATEVRRSLLKDGADWLDRPVADIPAAEIRKTLELIRDGDAKSKPPLKARPYMANRFFAYLAGFFRWCAEPGIDKVPDSPMIRLRKPWDGEAARSRFYDDDELKAIWAAADHIGGVAGAFLKVSMLTGKRRGALSAMKWSELGDDGVWTPHADKRLRKRNKRVHAVPLPKLVQRILAPMRPAADALPGSVYVFPGRRPQSHLHPGGLFQSKVRAKTGIDDFIVHALRHTVETRLAELGVQPHIRDFVLDHAPLRGSGSGYDHHHYQPEMRDALERWADHIERLVAPEGVKVLR